MIKFNCQKCREPMDAPNSLAGQSLKCPRCQRYNTVPANESDIANHIKEIGRKTGIKSRNIFIRLWKNCPAPFRIGFLGTCGSIAAITIILYLYQNPFTDSNTPKNDISLSHYESILSKRNLYYSHSSSGILHARNLNERKYSYDVSYDIPYISLWLDHNNNIVGISAKYTGGKINNVELPSPLEDLSGWLISEGKIPYYSKDNNIKYLELPESYVSLLDLYGGTKSGNMDVKQTFENLVDDSYTFSLANTKVYLESQTTKMGFPCFNYKRNLQISNWSVQIYLTRINLDDNNSFKHFTVSAINWIK